MINHLDPKVDIGSVSFRTDLDSLAGLTTDTGRAVVHLEAWLVELHYRAKQMRANVRKGSANFTGEEMGELKFQVASAKLVSQTLL